MNAAVIVYGSAVIAAVIVLVYIGHQAARYGENRPMWRSRSRWGRLVEMVPELAVEAVMGWMLVTLALLVPGLFIAWVLT